jgi:hypothetical protein
MVARLSLRLVAVLLVVCAVAAAQPAHAATLTVNSVTCWQTGTYPADPANYGTYACTANVSGGTGSYSYTWTVSTGWSPGGTFSGGQTITGNCKYNTVRINSVTVTDSSGATASGTGSIVCTRP